MVAILFAVPASAAPDEAPHPVEDRRISHVTPERMIYDAVVLRPWGLVQVLVGAALFVPSYPIAWLAGAGDDVLRACIEQPVERTFRRPLGEL